MSGEWKVYTLPDRIRLDEDAALLSFLRENRAGPVRLAAGKLRTLDARTLQVLLSAARSWRAAGLPLLLDDVHVAVEQSLRMLGVGPEMLDWKGAALPSRFWPSMIPARSAAWSRR